MNSNRSTTRHAAILFGSLTVVALVLSAAALPARAQLEIKLGHVGEP